MVEFGCHYHRIHAQMSMKIISREGLFSYQFTFFGLSQRPSGWRSLLILPCMVIFPSIIHLAKPMKEQGNMPKTLPPACSRPPWGLNSIQNWTGTSGRIFLRCQGRSSVRATSLSPLSATKMGSGRLSSRQQFLSTKITCLLRAESLKGTRLPAMKMRTGTKHQDQFQKLASPHLASLRSQPNTTPPAATRKPRTLLPPDRDITSMQLTISRK